MHPCAISLLPLNAAAKSLSRQTGRASLASYIIRLPHQAYLSASDFQKSHRQEISSARCSLNKEIVPLCARFAYANIAVFLDFVSGGRMGRLVPNFASGGRISIFVRKNIAGPTERSRRGGLPPLRKLAGKDLRFSMKMIPAVGPLASLQPACPAVGL